MTLSECLFAANALVGTTAFTLQLGVPAALVRRWKLAPVVEPLVWVLCGLGALWKGSPLSNALMGCMLLHGIAYVIRLHRGLRHWQQNTPSPLETQRTQLMDVRGQLARLHEQERMQASIQRTQEEQRIFRASMHRFEAILVTIESHLAYGNVDHAEHLITAFGKHLRGVLNEASSPFIRLGDSLEAARNYLTLMEALTNERLMIDLDDGAIPDAQLLRMTANFEITPWIEEVTWPLFEAAEQNTSLSASYTVFVRLSPHEIVLQMDHQSKKSVKLMGASNP